MPTSWSIADKTALCLALIQPCPRRETVSRAESSPSPASSAASRQSPPSTGPMPVHLTPSVLPVSSGWLVARSQFPLPQAQEEEAGRPAVGPQLYNLLVIKPLPAVVKVIMQMQVPPTHGETETARHDAAWIVLLRGTRVKPSWHQTGFVYVLDYSEYPMSCCYFMLHRQLFCAACVSAPGIQSSPCAVCDLPLFGPAAPCRIQDGSCITTRRLP